MTDDAKFARITLPRLVSSSEGISASKTIRLVHYDPREKTAGILQLEIVSLFDDYEMANTLLRKNEVDDLIVMLQFARQQIWGDPESESEPETKISKVDDLVIDLSWRPDRIRY